tara:strand:- start:2204 stop:2596 length:393 start_codon:yes stop_codon:yes gene_type:complete
MIFKIHLLVFIISGFVSIITLVYVGLAYKKNNCPPTIPYGLFPIFIPILYGVFGIINYYIINNVGVYYSWLVGILFGLILSLIGRFMLNLPILLFNFTKRTEYNVHLYAMLIYSCIFQFIITPLTKFIIH